MVPLATSAPAGLLSGIGLSTRTSEHATVAINSSLDVLVVFNSDRNDEDKPPLGTNLNGLPGLKQVEVAFYEYDSTSDSWDHRETKLLGSIDYDPLDLIPVQDFNATRCERPDVIAVQDKFFVTWTRTYDESITGASDAPAVYECAWIEIVQGPTTKEMDIYGLPGSPSAGYRLDFHTSGGQDLLVRECFGTPDAVVLNDLNDLYKVAVVYAHQTDFSNPATGDDTRSCELRLVTCTFDDQFNTIDSDPPVTIVPLIPFNGENSSKGFILPDLAPSGEDNAFWLTYEGQKNQTSRDGVIGIGYWRYDTAIWEQLAYRSFLGGELLRRRPMISSYPESASGAQEVSLTFSTVDPNAVPGVDDESANVFLKTLSYNAGLIQVRPLPAGTNPYFDWPNSLTLSDAKGVVVSGRSTPGIQFCMADELGAPGLTADCKIQAWNRVTGMMNTVYSFTPLLTTDTLGRPAASYVYKDLLLGFNPDYIAACFEKSEGGAPLKVFFGVMD